MSSLQNVNKVIIIGNLGKDPELRKTTKGNSVINLTIATNRGQKQPDGEWKDVTEWHRSVVWGKRAELCSEYLKKGDRVYVEGCLQTRNWTTKEGEERWSTEILSDDVKFLGSPARQGTQSESALTG